MEPKFTRRLEQILKIARREATAMGAGSAGSEHLLLAMIKEGSGVAVTALVRMGIDLNRVIEIIHEEYGRQYGFTPQFISPVAFNDEARRIIELAREKAMQYKHPYVGTEHLLLAILEDEDNVAAEILYEVGIPDVSTVAAEIFNILGETPQVPRAHKKSKTPAIDHFCRDITKLAKEGKLDPVIGREKEMERVIQILCRRKKNNPVLIGDPGVGKTAIVEGIAQRIVRGEVPYFLRNARLVALDLGAMVAGTKYRGQFEERVKTVLKEIREAPQKIILFIDEVHTVVGAGAAEGALDAANLLKPALARGEIQCIGATTYDEYRKHIERDKALERRFQPVHIAPPTVEETLKILEGLKKTYEEHHGVIYTPAALRAAVTLSEKYITDRFLPDKAIDVIDEAGSRVKLRVKESPIYRKLSKKLQEIIKKKNECVAHQEFEEAARLRDEQHKIQEKLREIEEAAMKKPRKVHEEDIREVISVWTGIPISKLKQRETERLLHMEDELKKKVVGQDQAIEAVARAIRRGRTGIKDPKRPIGSFLFLGPTGVGKTYLAKKLAEFLFDSESALIRLDMSEYMEKFNVSRLIGAPPGYVGYEEGGQLTEAVRRRPYSVILFDEFEKAHPEVYNILLQILEDGVLTDSWGRKVDFRNTVIILTSNIGTQRIRKSGIGFAPSEETIDYEKMRAAILEEVTHFFRKEFLNRLDEIIVFRPLSSEHMGKIVELMFDDIKHRVWEEKKIELVLTSSAKELLIEEGFDPELGARPLRRAMQRLLEDPLSEELLRNRYERKSKLYVVRAGNQLEFLPESKARSLIKG